MRQVSPSIEAEALRSQLKERLHGVIEEGKIDLVTTGVLAVATGPSGTEVGPSEFAESLVESPDLGVPERERAKAQVRLLSFMDIDPILVTGRALEVINEQPARFLSARILSDIRPVFGTDVEANPSAAVVVHTLRVTYATARRQEQFFVAMDADDLDALEAVVSRARRKAKSMSAILKAAGVPDVSPRGKESTHA